MARLTLIRHGKSQLGFDQALNSGLSELGHEQARTAAQTFSGLFPPQRILASPLLRAVESAQPLAERWGRSVELAEAITEIPSPDRPDRPDLKWRREWLNQIMVQRYGALSSEIEAWREQLRRFLIAQEHDALLFTHYLTINAAVGLASNDPRLVVCDPAYCAFEQLEVQDGKLIYLSKNSPQPLNRFAGT